MLPIPLIVLKGNQGEENSDVFCYASLYVLCKERQDVFQTFTTVGAATTANDV